MNLPKVPNEIYQAFVRLEQNPDWKTVNSWLHEVQALLTKQIVDINEEAQLRQAQGAARLSNHLVSSIDTARTVAAKINTRPQQLNGNTFI